MAGPIGRDQEMYAPGVLHIPQPETPQVQAVRELAQVESDLDNLQVERRRLAEQLEQADSRIATAADKRRAVRNTLAQLLGMSDLEEAEHVQAMGDVVVDQHNINLATKGWR